MDLKWNKKTLNTCRIISYHAIVQYLQTATSVQSQKQEINQGIIHQSYQRIKSFHRIEESMDHRPEIKTHKDCTHSQDYSESNRLCLYRLYRTNTV